MGFTAIQECPQCGGEVELDEADRLLRCPFCEVKSFLFADGWYRFALPHKTDNPNLIYVPYLRFKGSVFSCEMAEVRYRVVDITRLAVPFKRFPISMGLRPQAMKLRFARADPGQSFLKCLLSPRDLLTRAERQAEPSAGEAVFHKASIGDSVSLIYLPVYAEEGMLYDGITLHPMARLPRQGDLFSSIREVAPDWKLTFMATLCPRCGWDLEGERDSVVLTCSNCETAWEATRGGFAAISVEVGTGGGPESVYLPFWKMTVETSGIPISSYADFIRETNQPKVIRKEWEEQEMCFWAPAFKIQPNRFLHLSRQMTVAQGSVKPDAGFPGNHRYPVTLPLNEAKEGVKVTLAGSAVNRKKLLPRLPEVGLSLKGASLVYLPFRETVHELIQEHTQVAVNKKALEYGRFL